MKVVHTVKDFRKEDGGVSVVLAQLLPVMASMVVDQEFTLGSWRSRLSEIPDIKHYNFSGSKLVKEVFAEMSLVHDHGLWLPNNHKVAAQARIQQLPRVVSPHGMLEPWAMQFNAWKKKAAWHLFQQKDLATANVLHSTAPQETENLKKLGLGVPIATIPLGIEVPDSLPARERGAKKRILFLSRIQRKKGLEMLVEAWDAIRDPNWEIIIAGPEEAREKERIQQLIHQKGLQDNICFQHPVWGEDKWKLYRSADLFVLPTHSENFGLVIGEALACGLPVITTQGAPWQDLEEYRCGWWPPVEASAIRDAIQKAISLSDDERLNMGERGQQLVREKYSWQRVASQMLELYAWVLQQADQPQFVTNAD